MGFVKKSNPDTYGVTEEQWRDYVKFRLLIAWRIGLFTRSTLQRLFDILDLGIVPDNPPEYDFFEKD
jgi:hypothetical protein